MAFLRMSPRLPAVAGAFSFLLSLASPALAQSQTVPSFQRMVNDGVCTLSDAEKTALGQPSATHGARLGFLNPRGGATPNWAIGDTITRDSVFNSRRGGTVLELYNGENGNLAYAGAAFEPFTSAQINGVDRTSDNKVGGAFFFVFASTSTIVFEGRTTFAADQTRGPCDLIPADTEAPTTTLGLSPDTPANPAEIVISVQFNEDVVGFDDMTSDVTVTNGQVTAITGGPQTYTVTILPAAAGDVTVSVPAGAAEDAAGNGNLASTPITISNTPAQAQQTAIADFMLNRAALLAGAQPRLTHFLQGGSCGPTGLSVTQSGGNANGCASRGRSWAAFTSAWSDDASYTLGSVGAHMLVQPNLIAGGMVQFDSIEDDLSGIS
ncbi:MAG: Ig-like domain-containing protein, partial [Pseudomonadota bacterium]